MDRMKMNNKPTNQRLRVKQAVINRADPYILRVWAVFFALVITKLVSILIQS